MKPYISTLMHVLELAIVVTAGYLIVRFLNLDSDAMQFIATIVLGALAKFARASDKVPLTDYVNNPQNHANE